MKQKLLSVLFILVVSVSAIAQRTISGTVTSAKDKQPLIGATVIVEKTTIGTTTDIDGKYSLSVPENATNLIFSYTGMKSQTIAITENTINVALEDNEKVLGDVIVTALGIKRDQKSVGYATQKVNGADISSAKETNLVNALQGKVAGVQITGSSNLGGSSRIVMRGAKSIEGNNQPLFVIDGTPIDNSNYTTTEQARGALGYDYGNAAQDISPDDIADIQVLKGAAASALYGSRATNGVIIITTKKGLANKAQGKSPIGVTLSQSIGVDQVYVLPKYQNQYGGGTLDTFRNSILFPGEKRAQFSYDGSWGPKLDGKNVMQWYAYDEKYHPELYGKATPWSAQPNDIKNFYKLGVTSNTSLSLDGANDKGAFRLSLSNLNQKGTIENSQLNRFVANLNASYNFTNRLGANVGVTYTKTNGKGRPQTGYSNLSSNFTQWWQRQLDLDGMKDYKNPDGTQRSWNRGSETNGSPLYWDNPYWTIYENYETDQRDRVYGNVGLFYKLTDWLTAKGTLYADYYNDIRQERIAVGSVAAAKYSEDHYTMSDNNYEFTLNAKHSFKNKIDVSGLLGVNRRERNTRNNYQETRGGLLVPDWYSIENSVDPKGVTSTVTKKVVNSAFGQFSIGYGGFIYLDVTGRNDWSSTLPVKNSSYFYPSTSLSFIYTELFKSKWFTYGKIRGGWASVGSDTDPYQVENRPTASDNFGSQGVFVIPGSAKNPNLKPERTSTWEIGTDMRFWVDRITLDFTYYNTTTRDVIFKVATSGTSGFTSRFLNAGVLNNQGFELSTGFVPVRLKNGFEWRVGFNWAKNMNKVVELYKQDGKDIESYRLVQGPFAVSLEARPGQPYGVIVGTDYLKDGQGRKLTDGGFYIPTDNVKPLGSVLADFTGGINTTLSWKGLSLYALFDFQKGGKLFSLSNVWGKYSGTLEETAKDGIRENGVIVDGYQVTGTDADGNLTTDGTKNTTSVAAVDHFFNNQGYVIAAADVYDASFVKFRECRLTYSLPSKLFKTTPIQGISIGLSGRNLAILKKNVPNIDPESAVNSGNIQGLEGGQLPTARNISLNFSIKF